MRVRMLTDEKRALFAPLFEAARAGSQDALLEAARLVEEPLRKWIRQRIPRELQSKFDSIDILQVTYIDAVAAFQDFDGTTADEFVAWLMEIAIHNCDDLRKHFRRACRCAKCERALESKPAQRAVIADSYERLRILAVADERHRQRRWLSTAWRRLTVAERALLRARFWRRHSYREMAEQFGRSPEALRKLVQRLLGKLRASGREDDLEA